MWGRVFSYHPKFESVKVEYNDKNVQGEYMRLVDF